MMSTEREAREGRLTPFYAQDIETVMRKEGMEAMAARYIVAYEREKTIRKPAVQTYSLAIQEEACWAQSRPERCYAPVSSRQICSVDGLHAETLS